MATEGRRPATGLTQALFEGASRFDLFQAVRLLGRLAPDRKPVGHDGPPSAESVRFSNPPSLSFAPAAVARVRPPNRPGGPPVMESPALPISGPVGALPVRYTEHLLDRAAERDPTFAAFLDLFHHRLLSLFYRAWEKHRPPLGLERERDRRRASPTALSGPPSDGPFAGHLYALAGLGLAPLRDRNEFPDRLILAFVPLFADARRTPSGLESVVRHGLGLPATVVPFVEQTLRLGPDDRATLRGRGISGALGVDINLGDSVRDVASKFRLKVGPLDLNGFRGLAPETPAFRRLCQLTRLYIGEGLRFEVQVVLKAPEVPQCRLASGPGATRLGRDAWLGSHPAVADSEDAVFAAP